MGEHPALAALRGAIRAALPMPWSVPVGQVPDGGVDRRKPSRARSREQERERERMVRAEWEALRQRLAPVAAEYVARAGELLTDPHLGFTPDVDQGAVQRDYLSAVEAYQAAGKLLDEAEDLPDLVAAVVLADRAAERFAAARARYLGQRPPSTRPHCFYNPLHGHATDPPRPQKGRRGRRLVAREAAAARRPACERCRLALLAGQRPDVLPALTTVRDERGRPVTVLVPYYALPRHTSIWAGTACGSYDEDAPARVMRGEHRRRTP